MTRWLIIAVLLTQLHAQIIKIDAGSSSLMEGSGAGITAYLPSHTLSLSGGIGSGHPMIGLTDSFVLRHDQVILGTQNFSGATEASGLSLQGIGASVYRGSRDNHVGVFVGSSGYGYSTPYFQGTTPQHIGAAFYVQRRVGAFRFGTLTGVNGGKKTAIQSASVTRAKWKLTGAGGILSNTKYWAASGDWSPISHLHFNAAHDDSFNTFEGRTARSQANTAAVFSNIGRWTANAMIVKSVTQGQTTTGATAGAGVKLGWATARVDYYKSSGRTHFETVNYSLREDSQHWYANETVSQSKTTKSLSGGVGYHANRFSLSVDQAVVFVPFGGFVKATSVNLGFRVRDAQIALGTFIGLDRPKYTAYGSDYARGPMTSMMPGQKFHAPAGKFVIEGIVRDGKGQTVEGVAVMIGKQLVFSNASGVIFSRTRHKTAVSVHVSPEDYASAGRMKVVSSPENVTPGQTFEIIVALF